MWHVSSRSGVATLRTATHLLLTYLLTMHANRVSSRVLSDYFLTNLLPGTGSASVLA